MATASQLQTDYEAKLAAYNIELAENQQGLANEASKNWVLPYNNQRTDEGTFMDWLTSSKASLRAKKSAADTAYTLWQGALAAENKKADNDFRRDNPGVFQALNEKALTQQTTKYLIWGAIAVVIIIAGIVIYKRKFAA